MPIRNATVPSKISAMSPAAAASWPAMNSFRSRGAGAASHTRSASNGISMGLVIASATWLPVPLATTLTAAATANSARTIF